MDRLTDGELLVDAGISPRHAVLGFVLGGTLGLTFGVATGFSPLLRRAIDEKFQISRLTTTLEIAPLLVLWLGFGESSKVVLIASPVRGR